MQKIYKKENLEEKEYTCRKFIRSFDEDVDSNLGRGGEENAYNVKYSLQSQRNIISRNESSNTLEKKT